MNKMVKILVVHLMFFIFGILASATSENTGPQQTTNKKHDFVLSDFDK